MSSFQPYKPRNTKEKTLAKSFLKLKNEQDVANFLRDILTIKELEEFANRLEMARLLKKGWSYKKIARELKVSTTTVTRTAHWLYRGCGGYDKALK
ncbi:MAG: TrpR protein [Candidatus Roizmanbacteria bacterium GW2011_GWA2_35_19]|uniref:TrpR protein n=2 Tax=Candidatus Roizmaniibacteriota TaxID=1752723 RepID=A0A0G0BZ27_9BACT|nr:MAG: TrpR protein [Candidatus Roizmanbacteria bacterium GW2011_GWC2_35_12]KKP74478.1 MAG: TrpR protein [Candidatus Roizmanbacteria bacterium GW2011_GWA2_35_19]